MFNRDLVWDKKSYKEYLNYLKSLADTEDYRNFNLKLIPTKDKMIGIRTPKLKQIAKEIVKTNYISFLDNIGDTYYEEKLVEGFVIGYIETKEIFDKYFINFVKKIDNWATCDMVVSSCRIMKKDKSYYQFAGQLLKEKDEFSVRVGLIIILDHFVDSEHIIDILNKIDRIKSKYYYINMANAWLLSVCFVKYRDITLNYLQQSNLDKFTYNKAIQKIIESNRVSTSDKEMLRQMKVK